MGTSINNDTQIHMTVSSINLIASHRIVACARKHHSEFALKKRIHALCIMGVRYGIEEAGWNAKLSSASLFVCFCLSSHLVGIVYCLFVKQFSSSIRFAVNESQNINPCKSKTLKIMYEKNMAYKY